MATKTQYYNLDKPSYDEVADIEVINANFDKIDQQMRNNADGVNFAKGISSDAYDNSKLYAVGDYCIYDNKLYRCITAIESAEAFNIAKWKQTTVGKEVKQLNSNLADYGMDNKCSNLVNGYYNADDGSLVTNYNPLRYVCSTNSYYLKKGETIRVNGNSVDSIYLATYDTNGSFINRKNYYDKKDVTYIAQDNIIIKWSVSFSTDTPISQSPHIGVYVNNAIDEIKNDLEIIDKVVVENGITFTFSKTGNVKQIIWEGALINTVNAWNNLVTIPVEFIPNKNNFYFNDSYNSYKYYCNRTAIQPTQDATPGTYAGYITYI